MPTAFYSSESGCICSYWNQSFIAEPTYCSGCLKKNALVPCRPCIVRQLKAHVLIFLFIHVINKKTTKQNVKVMVNSVFFVKKKYFNDLLISDIIFYTLPKKQVC